MEYCTMRGASIPGPLRAPFRTLAGSGPGSGRGGVNIAKKSFYNRVFLENTRFNPHIDLRK